MANFTFFCDRTEGAMCKVGKWNRSYNYGSYCVQSRMDHIYIEISCLKSEAVLCVLKSQSGALGAFKYYLVRGIGWQVVIRKCICNNKKSN